jgi:hypothetical protein
MKTMRNQLSCTRVNRLRAQGYILQTNSEICDLSFGVRFAYRLCVTVLIPGVFFASIPVLSIMMVIAFAGILLPNHPFDYIYNGLFRKLMKLPKLPPRSVQLKFACGIATVILGATIFFFYHELMLAGYIFGSSLIASALLVGTTDICVPSILLNSIFGIKVRPSQVDA